MKKSYLILAAVAGLFASCSQEVLVDESVNQKVTDSPIGFSTFASYQTRAGAENNKDAQNLWDLEAHNTTFDVWAWKYYGGDWVSTAVYNKGTVTHASSAWTADPLKYWDKSAEKYYFYAASPTSTSWVLEDNSTADVHDDDYLTYAEFTLAGGATNNLSSSTVTSYVQSFAGVADVDLMIAEDNEVSRASYNKANPDVVNELFDHILSRLNVTVALKDGGTLETNNAVVKVTNFGITGVNLNNKGSFNEKAALGTDVLNEGTIKRWHTLSVNGTSYDLPGADISSTTLTDASLYIAQYLIIPQAITSEVLDRANGKKDTNADGVGDQNPEHPYFVISYTINDEPYTAYYNLANAFGVAADGTLNFCEGWQNTLNIKLDADVITFDAQVWEWTNKVNPNVIIED